MSQRALLIFIIIFSFILTVVSIVQGIIEFRKNKSIQFFDVFTDTIISPLINANQIAELFGQLDDKIQALSTELSHIKTSITDTTGDVDYTKSEELSEEALFLAQDIKKTAIGVNRHFSIDTSSSMIRTLHELAEKLDKLFESLQDEEEVSTLEEQLSLITHDVTGLKVKHGKKGLLAVPLLTIEHFFKYTVFSQKYLRKYEDELEETSVFANSLRPPMQFVRYALLNDGGEKAVIGTDGWYFYKPGVDYLIRPYMNDPRSMEVDPNDKPLVDDPITAIVAFKQQLDQKNIELLVVIVPGKPTMYPEKMNSGIDPVHTGRLSHSLHAIEDLRSQGIEVVDLFTPFLEEKKRDKEVGDVMYLSKDTHWRARGVRLAAKVVAQRVQQYRWIKGLSHQTEYVLDSVIVDRYGDVGFMTKLPDFGIRGLKLQFPPEKTKCYQVYKVKRDEEGTIVSRTLYKDDFRKAQILVLGDSFSRIYQTDEPRSAGWISHLAKQLSLPLASIVSDGGASTLVRQKLARKSKVLRGKKLVIWEFVERDFRYGAEGWKDVQLD